MAQARYDWTDDEKQRFYQQYGFYPNQFRGDAETLPGAPQGQWSNIDTSRIDEPRYDEGLDLFKDFDIRSGAVEEVSNRQRNAARSQQELDSEYQAKVDEINAMAASVAMVTGGQPRFVSPSRRSPTSATTQASVDKMTTDAFLQHFYKTIKDAGGQFTDEEVIQFLDATDAGPKEINALMSMKDLISLDGIKQLQRIDEQTGAVQYKYVWEFKPEDAATGWKEDRKDLEFQRTIAKDLAAEVLQQDKVTLQNTIAGLPKIVAEGGNKDLKQPRDRTEYYALAKALGLNRPEEFEILEKHYGHLLGKEDLKTYSHIVDGSPTYKRMTEYEAEKANKEKANKDNPWLYQGDVGVGAKTNEAKISEIISRNVLAAYAQKGPPGTPLPTFFQTWSKIQAEINGDPTVAVGAGGWSKIQEDAKAAYAGDARKDEKISTQEVLLSGALNELQGKPYTEVSKWLKDNKITDSNLRTSFITDWEKLNPKIEYDGPDMLFDAHGKRSDQIKSWSQYSRMLDEFPYADWDKVPRKPTVTLDYNAINQTSPTWRARAWEHYVDDDDKDQKRWIDETRWTEGQEGRIVEKSRATVKESIQSINHVRLNADKILSALAEQTGTLDGFTIKYIEKMLDPTGVVRASDVEFIETFGTIFEKAKVLSAKVSDWNASHKISDELRKDFADAVVQVYNVIHRNNVEQLKWERDRFDVFKDKHKTQYGGALNWNEVIPVSQWTAYTEYESNIDQLYDHFITTFGAKKKKINTETGSGDLPKFGGGG